MVVVNWYGLIALLKTPQAIIDRVITVTSKVMRSPAEVAAHVRNEREQWSKVVKVAGIRVN